MEPRLAYNDQLQIWEGEDRSQCLYVWMSSQTYDRYLRAYCEQHGIGDLHSAEAQAAHQRCLRLAFWLDCTDPDVHVRYYGQAAIEHMQRQAQEPGAGNAAERTPPCS